jgi:hypothetical protein
MVRTRMRRRDDFGAAAPRAIGEGCARMPWERAARTAARPRRGFTVRGVPWHVHGEARERALAEDDDYGEVRVYG